MNSLIMRKAIPKIFLNNLRGILDVVYIPYILLILTKANGYVFFIKSILKLKRNEIL